MPLNLMQVVCESRTCRTNTVLATCTETCTRFVAKPSSCACSFNGNTAGGNSTSLHVCETGCVLHVHTQARAHTHAVAANPHRMYSVSHALHGRALDACSIGATHITTRRGLFVDKRKTGTHLAATFKMLRSAPRIAWTLFALPLSSNKHAACTRSRRFESGRPTMHNAGRKCCDLTFHVSLLIPVSTNDVMIRTR
jgi:hypothetical protein